MCKRVVFDIETNGLLDEPNLMCHCIVIRNLDDETEVSQYSGSQIFQALRELESADEVWGHYAAFFDVPALRKLYPDFKLDNAKVFDSLLASQIAFPDLVKKDYEASNMMCDMPKALYGSHSLEAWGWRLGSAKTGLNISFDTFTPELLARCVQDTALTVDVIRQCQMLPARAWEIERKLAWYLSQQEANGFHFDVPEAQSLVARLRQKQSESRLTLTQWGGSWSAASGRPFVPKRDNAKLGYTKGVPVQKHKQVDFNPNSRAHIVKRLKEEYGWDPEVFTDKGSPKLDEAVLLPLSLAVKEDGTPRFPVVKTLLEHFEIGKQLGYVVDGKVAWLKEARPTGGSTGGAAIHGHINQMGTAYVRASHSRPNLGQVPREGDFRRLFYVPERINAVEWCLVGADMSGIELRMLAHFTTPYDGGELGRIILDGDIHQTNADTWGVSRTLAKTGIYALIYGAGDQKLGRALYPHHITERDHINAGRRARAGIMSRFTGLANLVERVRNKAQRQGFLTALDGRKLPIRSDYSALNNVLQSAAAVCAKQWILNTEARLYDTLGRQGWDGAWAAQMWVHDELQIACQRGVAACAGRAMVEGIEEAGRQFNLNVPITGAYKVGQNWAETH